MFLALRIPHLHHIFATTVLLQFSSWYFSSLKNMHSAQPRLPVQYALKQSSHEM